MRILTLAAAAALVSNAALAGGEHSPRAMAMKIFASADANGDQTLSAEEYGRVGLKNYGVTFAQMGLDSDGAITEAEYLDVFDAHHRPSGQPA